MIVFPDSHVDLMSNTPMTPQQIAARWDRELLRKWVKITQDNLRDFMQIKSAVDPLTFPNYAQNEALLTAFITDKQECYSKRVADEAKAVLLDQVLAYEQAIRDVARLTLQIDGRDGVEAVEAAYDPETGELVTEAVAAIEAVEPIPTTIEIDGEMVDNPAYLATLAELADCQATINNAAQNIIDLSVQRGILRG